MCTFCTALEEEIPITWKVRSTYANDNLIEKIEELNDYQYMSSDCFFTLRSHVDKDKDIQVSIEYSQILSSNIVNINIEPFSELLQFNFCPKCGKRISNNLKLASQEYSIELNW